MDEDSGRTGRARTWPSAAARLVHAAVTDGVVPAAILAAGQRGDHGAGPGDPPWPAYLGGVTQRGPDGREIDLDTVFDLASLTKVVATTPCVLRLVDRGEIDLDAPVARFLPEFGQDGGDRTEVTPRHLLAHTSGLPPHRPLYAMPGDVADKWAAVYREPLVTRPGDAVCYSDLGFMLLGQIVARVTSLGLDAAARELVFDPLGMDDTGYLPTAARERYAATEARPDTGLPQIGVVHDENAESLGGVAGHAGLFGTVADLRTYLVDGWLAEDGTFLSARIRREALSCQSGSATGGRRGLGWTLAGDQWDHMTAAWPDGRAGHTGYTGTSLAFDPDSGLWTVLLTNAVHLGRDHSGIILLRRTVHAAVAAWAAADGDSGPPGAAPRASR